MIENRSLWFARDGGYYLIPDDVTLAPGALSLRSITGATQSVDAEQAAAYLATSTEVSMHVKIAAERHLGGVRSALMNAVDRFGEAWRRSLSDDRTSGAMDEPERAAGSPQPVAPAGGADADRAALAGERDRGGEIAGDAGGPASGRAALPDDIGAKLDGLRGEMEEVVRSLGATLRAVSGQLAAPEIEPPGDLGPDGQADLEPGASQAELPRRPRLPDALRDAWQAAEALAEPAAAEQLERAAAWIDGVSERLSEALRERASEVRRQPAQTSATGEDMVGQQDDAADGADDGAAGGGGAEADDDRLDLN